MSCTLAPVHEVWTEYTVGAESACCCGLAWGVQGALAPLGASAALLGGYLVIKYLPQLSLQLVFNAYFWLLGSIAVAGSAGPPLRLLVHLLSLSLSPPFLHPLRQVAVCDAVTWCISSGLSHIHQLP